MTRVEAYHILGEMLGETFSAEQAEALSIAQDDIEFVDLMPNDVVAVVRCKDCIRCGFCGADTNLEVMGFYGYCSRGERKEDEHKL